MTKHYVESRIRQATKPSLSVPCNENITCSINLKPTHFIVAAGSCLISPLQNSWCVQVDNKHVPAPSIRKAIQSSHGLPGQDNIARRIHLHCTRNIIAGASDLEGPLPWDSTIDFHGINVGTANVWVAIQPAVRVTCQKHAARSIHITGIHEFRSGISLLEGPLMGPLTVQLHDENVILASVWVSMQASIAFTSDINIAIGITPNTIALVISAGSSLKTPAEVLCMPTAHAQSQGTDLHSTKAHDSLDQKKALPG